MAKITNSGIRKYLQEATAYDNQGSLFTDIRIHDTDILIRQKYSIFIELQINDNVEVVLPAGDMDFCRMSQYLDIAIYMLKHHFDKKGYYELFGKRNMPIIKDLFGKSTEQEKPINHCISCKHFAKWICPDIKIEYSETVCKMRTERGSLSGMMRVQRYREACNLYKMIKPKLK